MIKPTYGKAEDNQFIIVQFTQLLKHFKGCSRHL